MSDDLVRRLRAANVSSPQRISGSNIFAEAADAIEAKDAENERLRGEVYVPGAWHCAKCKFTLLQSNLNARDGTVTPRDTPGDKCPNCDSPLWRSTWKQDAFEMQDRAIEQMERAKLAEGALADQIAFRERDKYEIAQLREAVDKLTSGTDNGALCIEIGNQSAQLAARTSEIGGLRRALAEAQAHLAMRNSDLEEAARALAEAVEVLRPFAEIGTGESFAFATRELPDLVIARPNGSRLAFVGRDDFIAARQFVKEHGKP